jgi:hypothetical protein
VLENDNKDENHVDDQENDMTNNSKEEEKIVQNPPIENHDNSRNTEANTASPTYTLICFMAISKTFETLSNLTRRVH